MILKECQELVNANSSLAGKEILFEGEKYRIMYPLVCPTGNNKMSIFIYDLDNNDSENALSRFITNKDLRACVRCSNMSDGRKIFIEIDSIIVI